VNKLLSVIPVSPLLIQRLCIFTSFLAWLVPALYVLLAKDTLNEPLWQEEIWHTPLLILVIFFQVRIIRRFLIPYLRDTHTRRHDGKKFMFYHLLLMALSYLPILQLIRYHFFADTDDPEWINWSYLFISLGCASAIIVEIFAFNLLKSRIRTTAYFLTLFFLALFPLSVLMSDFGFLKTHEEVPFRSGSTYVFHDTIINTVIFEISSWHYVALITVLFLSFFDFKTSFLRGKLYPAIFFLFFSTYSSNLILAAVYDGSPLIQLPSSARAFLYNYFPHQGNWLHDRSVITAPDGASSYIRLHGKARKAAKRDNVDYRRIQWYYPNPLRTHQW
jgi:hypothetical protein